MKRNIIITLALAATLSASSQVWEQTDPNVGVYLELDTDNNTDLQVGVCFLNKTSLPMTAMGCDLVLPAGMSIDSYERGDILNSGHILSVMKYENRYDNRWFITSYCHYTQENSNVASKQFKRDGRVATLKINAETLSEGVYDFHLRNAEVVWTDGYSVKSYKTENACYEFKIYNGNLYPGVVTDIQGVEDKASAPAVGRQGIYTLEGVKVEKTQPGHIYIIDGKKVFVK